jgi:LPS-assembly protein
MLLGVPATALAQPLDASLPAETEPEPAATAPDSEALVGFSADQVSYDTSSELVTASGAVRMSRDGNYLAADRVTWNRRTGEVRADGNVVVVNPQGDKLVGESVVLTDSLRDGSIANLLVVLESGGRIAAARGTRTGDVTTLDNAIYSPCPVTSESGCPRNPSWSITAARVTYDPARSRVRFQGGRLQLFGVTMPLLPIFSIGTAGQGGGVSGWLVPDISYSSRNGLELAAPYYHRFAPNRDLTLTPHLYTGTWPALEARYRHLNRLGAFQIGAFGT